MVVWKPQQWFGQYHLAQFKLCSLSFRYFYLLGFQLMLSVSVAISQSLVAMLVLSSEDLTATQHWFLKFCWQSRACSPLQWKLVAHLSKIKLHQAAFSRCSNISDWGWRPHAHGQLAQCHCIFDNSTWGFSSLSIWNMVHWWSSYSLGFQI